VHRVALLCIVESLFEFRVLEVALEAICSFLAARTIELEMAAYKPPQFMLNYILFHHCNL